jgi:hypothetical protein
VKAPSRRRALHDAAIEILTAVGWFIVHPLALAEVLVHPARHGREGDVAAQLDPAVLVWPPLTSVCRQQPHSPH